MKNFKMLVVLMMGVLLFTSCSKEAALYTPIDENVWLQKQRGIVVYTDITCDNYIVETNQGYTVIKNWGGFTPRIGDWLYGDLNRWGMVDLYNRSQQTITTGNIKEYWLSWYNAREYVAYQCGR